MAVTDSAAFAVNACTLRFGFTTVSLLRHAQVDYTGSDFSSEYVVFDSSRLHVSHSDTALVWLGFPSGSVADVTLPSADTTLLHWEIYDGLPGVSGIGYALGQLSAARVQRHHPRFADAGDRAPDSRPGFGAHVRTRQQPAIL